MAKADQPAPAIQLVVKEPFDGYAKGDVIADSDEIKRVQEAGFDWCVTRVVANPQ